MQSPRVLFLLKHRTFDSTYDNAYSVDSEYGSTLDGPSSYTKHLASGLTISVDFVIQMLEEMGVQCKAVQVPDNNDIDREVHRYKPTHVIIEALWVVPEKFEVLHQLHPHVKWIVRIHSEIPFLSNEGIAIDWITRAAGYMDVVIAANSHNAKEDIHHILKSVYPGWTAHEMKKKVICLPNYYSLVAMEDLVAAMNLAPEPTCIRDLEFWNDDGVVLNAACFGSIRPLKNNLIQAVAAIRYAESEGATLHFHINGERVEGGSNVVRNLRALFLETKHVLVEHPWMDHNLFLRLLSWMDVSLCVSFSETFCIVAGDSVAAGVPTVVSTQVAWASCFAMADPTKSHSIESAIRRALGPSLSSVGKFLNRRSLRLYCRQARESWARYFGLGGRGGDQL